MKRALAAWIIALGAWCAGGSDGTIAAAPASPAKPNILFVLADDLRPDGLHILGNKTVRTPHLDRLLEGGFVFRNAYTLGSDRGAVCTPSRTMIQTGQSYLHARRVAPTLAQTVKAAGYASSRSGKFGNNPNQLDADFDQHLDGRDAEGNANNLIAFIRAHAGEKPLFLYLASNEPHDPQYAPAQYYPMYKPSEIPLPSAFLPWHPFDNGEMTVRDEQTLPWPRTKEGVTGKLARYYASISYLDDQVGRVLDALQAAGQGGNTIVMVAGDNGLSLGEHGLLGKQNLYEFGGMHVPLALAGPGIPKGESRAFVYLMDLFPTICELGGTNVPQGLDGRSLLPVIQGRATGVRDCAFTAYRDVQRAIRDQRWKLIRYPQINKTQLFDLQADPHELNDLADKPGSAAKIAEMMTLLEKVRREYGDTLELTSPNPKPAAWTPPAAGPGAGDANSRKPQRGKRGRSPE